MSNLNSANEEQRILIRQLCVTANDCPPITDKEAYKKFQDEILEPIRKQIIEAGRRKK